MNTDDGWLGLERIAPGQWAFELSAGLTRFDGKLYGGTGLAAMTVLMAGETSRPTLWVTTQFIGSADQGEVITCRVEVLAEGRRTSQLRATATVGDRVVMTALGATGEPRRGGVEVQVPDMPEVPGPDDCQPWLPGGVVEVPAGHRGWLEYADLREVEGQGSRLALWARILGHRQSPASLGFLADLVPTAVVRAAGRGGAGTSLDNAIRLGPPPDCEWILVELDPHLGFSGYLHGGARLWSPDGTLLAVASQTAVALVFD